MYYVGGVTSLAKKELAICSLYFGAYTQAAN